MLPNVMCATIKVEVEWGEVRPLVNLFVPDAVTVTSVSYYPCCLILNCLKHTELGGFCYMTDNGRVGEHAPDHGQVECLFVVKRQLPERNQSW